MNWSRTLESMEIFQNNGRFLHNSMKLTHPSLLSNGRHESPVRSDQCIKNRTAYDIGLFFAQANKVEVHDGSTRLETIFVVRLSQNAAKVVGIRNSANFHFSILSRKDNDDAYTYQ